MGIGDLSRENTDWGHEVLVQGSMHMIWWITAGTLRGIINMYMDSHSANERVRQLREAADRIRNSSKISGSARSASSSLVEIETSRALQNTAPHQTKLEIGSLAVPHCRLGATLWKRLEMAQ
jgi:hypothetical protein